MWTNVNFFVEYCEINTTGLLILTRPRRASTSAWRTDRSHPFYPGLQASPTGLRLRMGLTSDLTSGTALCLCTTMTRAATRVRKSAFVLPVLSPSISRWRWRECANTHWWVRKTILLFYFFSFGPPQTQSMWFRMLTSMSSFLAGRHQVSGNW